METNNITGFAIRFSIDRNGRQMAHRWASGWSMGVATTPGTIGRWIRVSALEASAWIAEGRAYVYGAQAVAA